MIKFTVNNIESNKILLSIISRIDSAKDGCLKLAKRDVFSDWMPSKKAGENLLEAATTLGDIRLSHSSVDGDLGEESFSVLYTNAVFDNIGVEGDDFIYHFNERVLQALLNVSNFLFHHYQVAELRGMKSKYTLNMILHCLELMVIRKKASLSFKQIEYLCGLENGKSEDRLFYRNVVQSCFADFCKLNKAPIEHKTLTKLNPSTNRSQNYALSLNSPWLGISGL